MSNAPIIVWFRNDLRLADNPALAEAAATGAPLLPVYILDDRTPGGWAMGGAARWWLHHSLLALRADLRARGAELFFLRGRATEAIPELIETTGACGLYWNMCFEPHWMASDEAIERDLKASGRTARRFNASLLFEPWRPHTRDGRPFRVFSPFWRYCLTLDPPSVPKPSPNRLSGLKDPPAKAISIDALELLPKIDWAGGLRATWTPGEAGAGTRLHAFLSERVSAYKSERNRPGIKAVSYLSPHLHFGEIGPRQIWHETIAATGDPRRKNMPKNETGGEAFLRELGWREFSYHLLYQFPHLPDRPLDPRFADFPWRTDAAGLKAWQRGETGFPIIDAGMRQLWQEGYMHNRVRMIVASFLIKDLRIDWRSGETWFWDTLVDADLANNSASWQWVAGCGADAAPYFRIFNPVLQGEKFDADGQYVRTYLPELRDLPDTVIHKPWAASPLELSAAGVTLGKTYPEPIVDHAEARKAALEAFETLKATD